MTFFFRYRFTGAFLAGAFLTTVFLVGEGVGLLLAPIAGLIEIARTSATSSAIFFEPIISAGPI
jgi:hypothetical protein